ncbi:MAG TPA: bifunctional glutamate N-acetyltransferase/amino-acid acetyltransferase ArgJ [bacterium]|nr:bifunctional glutamate N-acetyltransferase/amino-acid acetyltransferase ArgJ [bacterium]
MNPHKKFAVAGFRAGAVMAGVRYPGRLDLGLIAADRPVAAAGIFTTNQVKAPSVVLDARRLRSGLAQAVLANSGNANTCVGRRGMADTVSCTDALARALSIKPGLVLMSSTGVIGEPLPAVRIKAALPGLVKQLRPDGLTDFARAIMTTDTRMKIAQRSVALGRGRVKIAALGKGAGMIMPSLATMLVYIMTDAAIAAPALGRMIAAAARDSFNALTVDGDTSTSDSVIMMASGESGVRAEGSASARLGFQDALNDLCLELTVALAADGEGATKWFKICVTGAKTGAEADAVARRVANSPLVKTAFHAADPNWGRVMMAVGSAGVKVVPDRVDVDFADGKGRKVSVVKNGALSPLYSEARARKVLAGTGFGVNINLKRGKAGRVIYTCDLSAAYVKINAEYRT